MDLESAIGRYVRERRGVLANGTLLKHAMTLADLEHRMGTGSMSLDALTTDLIRRWRDAKNIKASSANKYVDRVNAFYTYALKHGWCTMNPCDALDPLTEEPPSRVRLPPETLSLMLDTARHPRDRAMIALATELLLRGGEIAALRVGDLNLDTCTLTVRVEKQRDKELMVDEMAITDELAQELRNWLRDYRREAGLIRPTHFLFPNLWDRLGRGGRESGLAPATPIAHPWEVVKLALVNSGVPVPAGAGFHTIRRTAARLLFDYLVETGGVDRALSHVSSLMHHSSRRTTELYLGVTGDRVLRNKIIRNSGVSPLALSRANSDNQPTAEIATLAVSPSPSAVV